MSISRIPPKDLDAEEYLLGSLMFDPGDGNNRFIDEVRAIVQPSDFASEDFRGICEAIFTLHSKGKPIDAVTLFDHISQTKAVDKDVFMALAINLQQRIAHGHYASEYARIVRDKSIRREFYYASLSNHDDIFDPRIETDELVCRTEDRIRKIQERLAGENVQSFANIVSDVVSGLDTDQPSGIETGYRPLDRVIDGLKPSQLIVVAARPGVGKTSLLLGTVRHVAETYGHVVLFSAEMSRAEVVIRYLAASIGVDVPSLRGIARNSTHRDRLHVEATRLSDLPITVIDTPGLRLSEVEAICRLQRRKTGLELVGIDYLQLLEPDDKRANVADQVGQMSRDSKRLAKSVNAPVVLLSQLNRSIESRGEDRRPKLSDLRSSGQIEADADAVVFLDRRHMWDRSADESKSQVYVAKNRNGQLADFEIDWHGPTMTFGRSCQPTAADFP